MQQVLLSFLETADLNKEADREHIAALRRVIASLPAEEAVVVPPVVTAPVAAAPVVETASVVAKVDEPKKVSHLGRKGIPREKFLEAGLFTHPASKVARELGCTLACVYENRRRFREDPDFKKEKPAEATPQTDVAKYKAAGLGTKTDAEVAAALGVTRERVRQVRVAHDIPRVPVASERWKEGVDQIRDLAAAGNTAEQIAQIIGYSVISVRAKAAKAGIEIIHGQTKNLLVTKEQLKAALETSSSLREASKKLGLKHDTHIYRYIRRWNMRAEVKMPDGRAA
jgi:DNA-binding CsgD family transcriptional regulator